MLTEKHKRLHESKSGSKITSFFTKSSSDSFDKEGKSVAAAEGAFIYHTVKHAHSYLSADCSGNLFSCLFPDSKIAKKYNCGRTKATKVIQNVLAPAYRELIIKELSNNNNNRCKYFSIGTDASNKGNVKTFPLVLRYFNKNVGVTSKLLSFFP